MIIYLGEKNLSAGYAYKTHPGNSLFFSGANSNNLKDVTLRLPSGLLTCVTGVSGSGKSTLVNQTLYPILANKLNGAGGQSLSYSEIQGLSNFDKVIDIDQSPIGRTPRSNPATYTGLFTPIRELSQTRKNPDREVTNQVGSASM